MKCLQERYNRPRLIHQAHVRKIIEVPSLKDKNSAGKEFRRLHDVLQQHLRALKAMDKEPSASFIPSLIEMKLDPDTMFEWQKASQDSTDVLHYTKLLEFLNLRAQASESASPESRKSTRNDYPLTKKRLPNRSTSLVANTSGTTSNCVLYKTERHPLYACQARRQEGFEGVRSNPPFGSKRFYMHRLTVHFKYPIAVAVLRGGGGGRTPPQTARLAWSRGGRHAIIYTATAS